MIKLLFSILFSVTIVVLLIFYQNKQSFSFFNKYKNKIKNTDEIEKINSFINHGYGNIYTIIKKLNIDMQLNKKEKNKLNDEIILYVLKEDNFNFWIIENNFFKLAKKIKKFQNIIENDSTTLYLLYFDKADKKSIYYIHRLYYYNHDIFIKNMPLQGLITYEYYYMTNDENKNYYSEKCKEINEILKKKFHLKKKKYIKYLYKKYARPVIINYSRAAIIAYNYEQNYIKTGIEIDFYNYQRKEILKMLNVSESSLKRINELKYLKKIRDYFPTAIYQYRSKWLGRQSLDIYIPEIKVAFEVQGKQHYKPYKEYGGERQFKLQQERDKRKKDLCHTNGIKLYYIGKYENRNVEDIIKEIKESNF